MGSDRRWLWGVFLLVCSYVGCEQREQAAKIKAATALAGDALIKISHLEAEIADLDDALEECKAKAEEVDGLDSRLDDVETRLNM